MHRQNPKTKKNHHHQSLEQIGDLISPEDSETENSLEVKLPKLFAEMQEDWATAMKLKIEQSKSYSEIASQMNASHAQVRTWIFRARQFLRKHLVEST